MVYARRRRSYRRYRSRRPIGMRRNFRRRRIGTRRPYPRKFNLLSKSTRPSSRVFREIDRTPNFAGDSLLVQVKYTNDTFDNRATGEYFTGFTVPGNFFEETLEPQLQQHAEDFKYCRVVKSTIVVTHQNIGGTQMKRVGITQLPEGIGLAQVPIWVSNTSPAEQPRTVSTTLGALGSSRSVRTLKATGTNMTACGDHSLFVYQAQIPTGSLSTVPGFAWRWYVWQGTEQNAGSSETTGLQLSVTVYYTVKFYDRILKLS